MSTKSSKTHVYCVPGMSAKAAIFEHLKLPEDQYEIHWIEWVNPEKKETLQAYTKRLCKNITHDNVILIGVSLGGVIVQEMINFVSVKQIVLISTVKTKYEIPPYMHFMRKTGLYRLIPTFLVKHFDKFEKWPLGKYIKGRLHIYNKYMAMDNPVYLKWAFKQMLYWNRQKPLPGLIHIHGNKDYVFPIKYIKDCHVVDGATHLLVINRFRWINENLFQLLATKNNSH